MTSSLANANQTVLNKFCWMARQLRNFNDSNSIILWSNAMMSVKNLLLHQLDTETPHSPIISSGSYRDTLCKYSISRPTYLSYPPMTKPRRILTPSSSPSLNFVPQSPSPQTIQHHRWLSVLPTNTKIDIQMPPIKKRKTMILPPQVDCNSQTHHQLATPKTIKKRKTMILPPQVDCNSQTPHQLATPKTIKKRKTTILPPQVDCNSQTHHQLATPKTTTLPQTRKKAQPISTPHNNSAEKWWCEPPTDKEYKLEVESLFTDAARLRVNAMSLLDDNRNKYPRCYRYFKRRHLEFNKSTS